MSNQQGFTILVVEDSPPNRTILVHLLRKLGFNVIECADGATAWEILQNQDTKVEAILSDLMMPGLDGIQLLEKVRSDSRHNGVPFVLVTAVNDKNKIVNAKSQRVSGYILKPVTFQRVTAKLQELFPGYQFPKAAS